MIEDGDITEYRSHRILPCPLHRRTLDLEGPSFEHDCGFISLADAAGTIDERLARRSGLREFIVMNHDYVLLAS
jgi:hypothetical protein